MVSYSEKYGELLRGISDEADAMSLECFRNSSLRVERKMDGTALTQADGAVEKMARKRVAESGLALDVYGEEQGTGGGKADGKSAAGRARLIIDPIDGTEEFSRGIPTFGTLLGIELNGEIVAGMCSAPALGTRWWAYRGSGRFGTGRRFAFRGLRAKRGDGFYDGYGAEQECGGSGADSTVAGCFAE